jgi:hypothetical protein
MIVHCRWHVVDDDVPSDADAAAAAAAVTT